MRRVIPVERSTFYMAHHHGEQMSPNPQAYQTRKEPHDHSLVTMCGMIRRKVQKLRVSPPKKKTKEDYGWISYFCIAAQ